MAYNGIPVIIVTPDDKGNYTVKETAVFATARKHPDLKGKLKAVVKADVAEDVATAKAVATRQALIDATAENIDELAKAAEKAAIKIEDATEAYAAAVHDFIFTGFKGAGYTPEEAERYAMYIDPERLDELKSKCLIGSGRLDFTKAPPSL